MRIGDMLVAAGLATEEQVRQALERQKETGLRLGEELVELGVVTEAQLTQILSNQLSVPWVSLYHVEFSRELLNLLPAKLADHYGVIPVYVRQVRGHGETLFVAMDDPTNEEALRRVREVVGMPVKAMVAAPSDIKNAVRVYYFGARPRPEPARAVEEELAEEADVPEAEPAAPPPADAPAEAPREAQRDEPPAPEPAPAAEEEPEPAPTDRKPAAKKQPPMITLTLLDGTTVRLPAPRSKQSPAEQAEEAADESGSLTANDLIAALVARSQGSDVTDVLPEDSWEPLFAALLSVLLRKGLIADWEFVEEWRRRQG